MGLALASIITSNSSSVMVVAFAVSTVLRSAEAVARRAKRGRRPATASDAAPGVLVNAAWVGGWVV